MPLPLKNTMGIQSKMIKVKSLTKKFQKDIVAVDNISFEVNEGKMACFMGTSGCGKTTILQMINRLVEPTSGEIFIGDWKSSEVHPIKWRRGIGYVVQGAGLLPHLTVKDNISFLAKILGLDSQKREKRVRELMSLVSISYENLSHRYPHELSGGQKQRVGIARALMEDPPVLLMDEPFAALDPLLTQSLHEEILGLNKKLNKTIIVVTHDLQEAFRLGDVIFLMDKGKVVQQGTKEYFLENPKNNFVAEFMKRKRKENK